MTHFALTADDDRVVAAFGAALRRAGMRVTTCELWGARAFYARFGGAAGWAALPLPDQLRANPKVHRFVAWLALTQRLRPSAAYLVAYRPKLTRMATWHDPAFAAAFEQTAALLGYAPAAIARQWAALLLLCARAGVAPARLTHAQLDAARRELCAAGREQGRALRELRAGCYGLEATLFHAGVTDELPRRASPDHAARRQAEWAALAERAPTLVATMRRYLEQVALSLRPGTVDHHEGVLREFARFLREDGAVTAVAAVTRRHVERYKAWLAERPAQRSARLHRHTIRERLGILRSFFERIGEWGWEDAPARVPLVPADLPIPDEALPRFLDDAAAAKLLVAARAHPDPFVRLTVEFLARTGLRKGEYLRLTTDAVVQIGSAYWLRVPLGKLHNDRYIPLHPQLKALLDAWLAERPKELRTNLLFVERGRPMPESRVDRAVAAVARAAGIGHVSPHQLRHTLATQAINRGMSLEAIAALLGHRSLRMTMVYARIADRTVADEYFAVSEQVEALYDRPKALPSTAEGREMAKLRREMGRRMLGNGYCARPVELDCHFETICESCSFFVTTTEFQPTLERQLEDAVAKGQVGRQKIFERLLARLREQAS